LPPSEPDRKKAAFAMTEPHSDSYAGPGPTRLLFREDAYLAASRAQVTAINERGIILDGTVFYATGGGQPGDSGRLVRSDGSKLAIGTAVYDPADKTRVIHVPLDNAVLPSVGEVVLAELDWPLRHRRMRIHTALHLLSCVLPFPVTGGSIGDGEGRLDFDIPEGGLDKAAISEQLATLVARGAEVTERWITDAELDANPGLVKTMSVQPPRGSGRIRLVEIAGIDLQPCGGTHVRNTSEIGAVAVTEIEKKGKMNRRVRIALLPPN
jgi:misacylated tRNA(Ala) deacylase